MADFYILLDIGEKFVNRFVIMKKLIISCLVLATSSLEAQAYCFKEAGARYNIPSGLLAAIAQTESSMDSRAMSHTNDIGLMQINDSWVPILQSRFGISKAQLWEPCTNVMVGAWILANEFRSRGRNWNAIGAYNARCSRLKGINCSIARQRYSMKVWNNWKRQNSI